MPDNHTRGILQNCYSYITLELVLMLFVETLTLAKLNVAVSSHQQAPTFLDSVREWGSLITRSVAVSCGICNL